MRNLKEILNPKPEIQNGNPCLRVVIWDLVLLSDFDIRISNLMTALHGIYF
jgi:hypothetical protein